MSKLNLLELKVIEVALSRSVMSIENHKQKVTQKDNLDRLSKKEALHSGALEKIKLMIKEQEQ